MLPQAVINGPQTIHDIGPHFSCTRDRCMARTKKAACGGRGHASLPVDGTYDVDLVRGCRGGRLIFFFLGVRRVTFVFVK